MTTIPTGGSGGTGGVYPVLTIGDGGSGDRMLVKSIKEFTRVMTWNGVKKHKQVAILLDLGVRIGKGGKENDLVDPADAKNFPDNACGYCGKTGNGGHGGGCPNG